MAVNWSKVLTWTCLVAGIIFLILAGVAIFAGSSWVVTAIGTLASIALGALLIYVFVKRYKGQPVNLQADATAAGKKVQSMLSDSSKTE